MGMPAARLGDMTFHGGTIIMGCPNVLIGGMPAARVGDAHVCPLANPAPTPVPHVGMPIVMGSLGVFIGGLPAARMGDTAPCTGPPDSIATGCFTVLIGDIGGAGVGAGGGAGGAGAGAGAGAGSAAAGAEASAAIAGGGGSDQDHTHWLDAEFVDKAGLPIGGVGFELTGPGECDQSGRLSCAIRRGGIEEGNYRIRLRGITGVRWSVEEAEVGEEVEMIVETAGIEDGTEAELSVYIRDGNYTDHLLEEFDAVVNGDEVRVSWTLEVDDNLLEICDRKEQKRRYSRPFFFYKVSIGSQVEQSGVMRFRDYVEVVYRDDEGNPLAGKSYSAHLGDGRILRGTLDNDGKARIENVSPGRVRIELDLRS